MHTPTVTASELRQGATTQYFEFYCVDQCGEESILAAIPGSGETEPERLRDAEREAAALDIGRGHGPVQVRGARGGGLRLEIAVREALTTGVVVFGDRGVEDALHTLLDVWHETATADDWAEIMAEVGPAIRFSNHVTEWDESKGRRRTVSRQAYLPAAGTT